MCGQVQGIDEEAEVVYFTANAREAAEDPYYQHLYSVNLDGDDLKLLDPGDFDHRVEMGESSQFFIDNYSRVNTPPSAALIGADGAKVLDSRSGRLQASLKRRGISSLSRTASRRPIA